MKFRLIRINVVWQYHTKQTINHMKEHNESH